jgi:anhydro-N-acetylmuramic acid kinase
MSGTSVDGIDVACVDLELDGDELGCRYRGVLSVPFDAALRERIVAVLPPGRPGAGELCQLHAELGHAYAGAFAAAAGELAGGQADFAVLHGQTFFPWVDDAGRALGSGPRQRPAIVGLLLLATPLLLPRRDHPVPRGQEPVTAGQTIP